LSSGAGGAGSIILAATVLAAVAYYVAAIIKRQGQRTLNSFSGKDLRQEVVAPAATAAFHGDAFRPRMLFQKR